MKGLGTAFITPFTKDGNIDYIALGKLIEYQIAGGADYLVILGTTSEVPTLTHKEQDEIIAYVVKQVAGRMPLVLGIGGNSTAAVVERIEELKEQLVAHFAGILSVTPYYNEIDRINEVSFQVELSDYVDIDNILNNLREGVSISNLFKFEDCEFKFIREASLKLFGCYPINIREV